MEKTLDRFQRGVINTYLWILSIGGIYVLWLKLTGKSLKCMVNASTGLLCPGCGCSRMFLALLRLDLAAAWRHNAVVLVLLFLWNVIAGAVFWGKPAFARKATFLYGALFASIGVLAGFGVLRNL